MANPKADPLERPFRNFADAWAPPQLTDAVPPIWDVQMQFKHLCKFLRQAGLFDDAFTQLECTHEFRARSGGIALDFESFKACVKDLAETQHAPLIGGQALEKMLTSSIVRYGMEPALLPLDVDSLTCDVIVQDELAESAALVRLLFERYAVQKKEAAQDNEDDEAEGREIMAGNAGASDGRSKMSLQGMIDLATDFELVGTFCREQDVSTAVSEAIGIGAAAKFDVSVRDGMYLPDFIDALVLLAHHMYDVKPLDDLFKTTIERVRDMLARIVLRFESVFRRPVRDVLPDGELPPVATFSDLLTGVAQFRNEGEQISAIFAHHSDGPGKMGPKGLYKLISECGLLDNTITMARVLQVYSAATGLKPAEIKAARSSGQMLGMNELQFGAALVYLASYVYIKSAGGATRKVEMLMKDKILPKAGRREVDPVLEVLLEPDAIETLSRYNEELRSKYKHFAALYEGQDLLRKTTAHAVAAPSTGRVGGKHPWEVQDEDDNSSLSLTEFNEFARVCGLFPEVLSSSDCTWVFNSALTRDSGSDELTFPQFVEAIGRAALLKDEVTATPSSLRITTLFRAMHLGGEGDLGENEDGDMSDEYVDRTGPVDKEEMRSHLSVVTQETFAVADGNKSGAVRTESEKWSDQQDRNDTVIRNRPVRPVRARAAPPAAKSTKPADAKNVAPAKKGDSSQSKAKTLDWAERGEQAEVMVAGTGKVSAQRPASAPGARQAWAEDNGGAGGARISATARASAGARASDAEPEYRYRPAAAATAGRAAASLGLGARQMAPGRGRLGAAPEPLCLIHEMLYSPACPYEEVAEEVDHGFAAHQFGDCEMALQCYQDAYEMWIDYTVEDTGCDVHPEVKVFLLNAIGMVYQTAGQQEDTLAAFLDAKTEGLNLDPDHPDVALSLSNLGAAYYRLGSIGMALEFYDQAISIRESALGKRHVDTGLLYNNKACCMSLRGDTTATRALLYSAHEIFVDGLGPTHPRTFAALRNVTRASKLPLNVDRNVGRLPRSDMTKMGLSGGGADAKNGGKGKGKGKMGGKGKKKKKKK